MRPRLCPVLRILKVNAATSYNFIIGKRKELQQRILAMSPAEKEKSLASTSRRYSIKRKS
jgi:hypothetical protein